MEQPCGRLSYAYFSVRGLSDHHVAVGVWLGEGHLPLMHVRVSVKAQQPEKLTAAAYEQVAALGVGMRLAMSRSEQIKAFEGSYLH
nr:hypothetical protein [Paenibacillus marchantiophytorum]